MGLLSIITVLLTSSGANPLGNYTVHDGYSCGIHSVNDFVSYIQHHGLWMQKEVSTLEECALQCDSNPTCGAANVVVKPDGKPICQILKHSPDWHKRIVPAPGNCLVRKHINGSMASNHSRRLQTAQNAASGVCSISNMPDHYKPYHKVLGGMLMVKIANMESPCACEKECWKQKTCQAWEHQSLRQTVTTGDCFLYKNNGWNDLFVTLNEYNPETVVDVSRPTGVYVSAMRIDI